MRSFSLFPLLVVLLSSCGNYLPEATDSQIKASFKGEVAVVETDEARSRFKYYGPAVVNRSQSVIDDPRFSFASHLVKRLREKGYKARKTSEPTSKGSILLRPKAPSGDGSLLGGGVIKSRAFGRNPDPLVHCNYGWRFTDRTQGVSRDEPFTFAEPSYFAASVEMPREFSSWESLTASERNRLAAGMRAQMDDAADRVIKYLGL